MGRPKTKPRAQRKFAQGAFIPQPQNQPSSLPTILPARAIHRAVNKPGPVTYNNCTVTGMLTVMSLGKIHPHINLSPVVKLEYVPELVLKAANSGVKKKSKEDNFSVKKKYELRSRPNVEMRRGSVSDSGDDMPLSFLSGDISPSPIKTKSLDGRKRSDQQVIARLSPSLAADTATVSHTQNGSGISDSRLPPNLSKKPNKPAKGKAFGKIKNNMAKKIKNLRVAQRERLRSALKSSSELDNMIIDDAKPDIITHLQPTAELITKQDSAEAPITKISNCKKSEATKESKKSEETDSIMPRNTAPNDFVATTSESCSSAHNSTPFKLPTRNTRTKSNKKICASHLLPGLQEMLLSTPTSVSYCNACKRCELVNKYKNVYSMLPVSDPHEPDILATTPRDVYEFDSDEEGLKILRRGRELVRNVLTTKRLSFWLCNLEMTLKKTMFLDAHKLGTLKRNLQMGKDDVTVNKIISRIDYLNQCLMEDKKELEAVKTKRKTKVTKNVVAVASKPTLKRSKEPDEPDEPQSLSALQMGKEYLTVKKIISRTDYLNQCLMEDKKELEAVKTKRKTKVTKNVVAVASKPTLKRSKEPDEPDEPQSLSAPKRTRNQMRTSLKPDQSTEENKKTTVKKVSSPPQGISTAPDSKSSKASTSLKYKVSLFAAAKKLNIPLVSIPIMDASLISKFQENDASSQHAKLPIDLPDKECDSTPCNDTTSPNPLPAKSLSQMVEGLSKPNQQKIIHNMLQLKKWYNKLNSSTPAIASTSRSHSTPIASSNASNPESFPANIIRRTPRHIESFVNMFSTKEMSASFPTEDLDNKFVPVEKLTYKPTPEEFMDPINYIRKIQSTASQYGICKIIPPEGFDVPCHLDDSSMFTTINQYLGRLYQRWGPTARELIGIQTYVAMIANTRERDQFTRCPIFDGLELDLVKLYDVVLEHGGIEELFAHSERWASITEQMGFVSTRGKTDHRKLEKLYCKHVLPYESLTPYEREKILRKVDLVWQERYRSLCLRAQRPLHYQKRMLGECESDDDETILAANCEDVRIVGKPCFDRIEECTAKGRTMNLSTYRRLASQIRAMHFPPGTNPTTKEIEEEYWKILSQGSEHVCVQSAYIDTAVDKLGHTSDPGGSGGSHPWNLKRLGENPSNVLSFLGKTLSVTDPTLSLNQLYSTNCWHKDPHLLAWMDYMHQGSTKIWYAVSEQQSGLFREAMEHLSPFAVQNKGIWLASDTTMVPPALLLAQDVKLQRIEQNPGEFIVVFPGAYASSIATGLTISESIYFENKEWVKNIDQIFQQMRDDYEPGMFSNIVLLFRMARDPKLSKELLPSIHKSIEGIINSELAIRKEAARLNFTLTLVKPEGNGGPVSWPNQEECSICRAPLILSKTVRYNELRLLMCLTHGVQLYNCAPADERGTPPPIIIIYTEAELLEILDSVRRRANGEALVLTSKDIDVTVKIEEYFEDAANPEAD